ncbi:putative regulator of chromosome condensation 1/beta-lactamase-inhibitor protein II [Plasmopara halstedii]
MEALQLLDCAYVNDRYENLHKRRQRLDQIHHFVNEVTDRSSNSKQLDYDQGKQWKNAHPTMALDAKRSTSYLEKKLLVLQNILDELYAEEEADLNITMPSSKETFKQLDTMDANTPMSFEELPAPTQIILKMFFRTCQSMRDTANIASNCRLLVLIATKVPFILKTIPTCVLSPGLKDETQLNQKYGDNICSVFDQLMWLFEELLRPKRYAEAAENTNLSVEDLGHVMVAYVALSLKFGRLSYLLKAIKLLLENANELTEARLELLHPLFKELTDAKIERPLATFCEDDRPCGYLMTFGKGDHGKLGHGQCVHVSCQDGNCTENKMVPTLVAATKDVLFSRVSSLSTHSIAITAEGEAMTWGNGDKYRLGHGSSTKEYAPRTIEFLSQKGRIRDVSCGLGHTLALMNSGNLFAWGNGSNGRLGLGDTNDRSNPTRVDISNTLRDIEGKTNVSSPVTFRHIFCGASHSLGISWEGRAYAWGKNNQGQCGHGHTKDQWTVHEIASFRNCEGGINNECVTYAAGGWEHTLFCTASGRVYSCGCGYKDSRRAGVPPVLGHSDCDRRLLPTLVQSLDDAQEEIVKVACGWDHSLAIAANGKVYTWGSGTNGKLGHGSEESFDVPMLVRCLIGKHVKDAKAGCEHTVFMTNDHEVWTCGQGDSGRLGHGDNQIRNVPTKIELFAQCEVNPIALAVGDKYNLVLVQKHDLHSENNNTKRDVVSIGEPLRQSSTDHAPSCEDSEFCQGRCWMVDIKKGYACRNIDLGATWVLNYAEKLNRNNISPNTASVNNYSAIRCALLIAGHIDRLATCYSTDEQDTTKKPKHIMTTTPEVEKSNLIPYAVDTSYETLEMLFHLLQWTCLSVTSEGQHTFGNNCKMDAPCLTLQEQMSFALSCLRVLRLNLKKLHDLFFLSTQRNEDTHLISMTDVLGRLYELLNHLSNLKGEDCVRHFANGSIPSDDPEILYATGDAISHHAACALKIGFGVFYPTAATRRRLLWKILDDCEKDACTPSMGTIILVNQLCTDTNMVDFFRYLSAPDPKSLCNEQLSHVSSERAKKLDINAVKSVMVVLLRRCSVEAVKQLDNITRTEFLKESDCFSRLLHVLQTHYFSFAYRSAMQTKEKHTSSEPGKLQSMDSEQVMPSLLDYVDALMAESMTVLKHLHKVTRQHEDAITWRLNGSFFHTLLPSAVESLSILLSEQKYHAKTDVSQPSINLKLVERILPNLCAILKLVDEISWKSFDRGDDSDRTHIENAAPSKQFIFMAQKRNWFVDLGDACALLCGKLSCELFYQWKISDIESDDRHQHDDYLSLVISEGRISQLYQKGLPATKKHFSSSISSILEGERLGGFEEEDERPTSEEGSDSTGSSFSSAYDDQQFLLRLCDTSVSLYSKSFWPWAAGMLSLDGDFTNEAHQIYTLVVSVLAWHLELSSELRSIYKLYDLEARNGSISGAMTPKSRIWDLLSVLLRVTKWRSWDFNFVGMEAVTNAVSASHFLINLQPNSIFVPLIFQCGELESDDLSWNKSDDTFLNLLKFLTSSHEMSIIQHSLEAKDNDEALLRAGVCLLHDLLRKLATSSVKSYLLDEFVADICGSNRMKTGLGNPQLRISLTRGKGKDIDKAIESFFVQLARIISSDDASIDLKKKALLIWTVPMKDTKCDVESAIALIAKSGIMITLTDKLRNESNLPGTRRDVNAVIECAMNDHQNDDWKRTFQVESKLTTKLMPICGMLFHQTPMQILNSLTWEAFYAIALQLSKSQPFAKLQPNLFLQSAKASLHNKELLTPLNTLMSPRRRLTLPEKVVVSSTDDIIAQMMDGLYSMLESTKLHMDNLCIFTNEYETMTTEVGVISAMSEPCARQKLDRSLFNLLGCPLQISQSSSSKICMQRVIDGKTSENIAHKSITVSFWVHVEVTGVLESREIPSANSTLLLSRESSLRLLTFCTSDLADPDTDRSILVLIRQTNHEHVSMVLSMRCDGDTKDDWLSISIDEPIPREKWSQIVLIFDKESTDHLQVFVGAKRSTLNNGVAEDHDYFIFCLNVLHKAELWAQIIAGGNIGKNEFRYGVDPATLFRQSQLPKRSSHELTAILDDIFISFETFSEERIIRMQHNGTFLFHLKRQQETQSYCAAVLSLLCKLSCTSPSSPEDTSARQPSSDQWITLLIDMLVGSCSKHELLQLYLCQLLENILPRTPPRPEFNLRTLSQRLLEMCQFKSWIFDGLFITSNEQEFQTMTLPLRKQNETLYRAMRQRGMLTCREDILFRNDTPFFETAFSALAPKPKISLLYAAAIHLFQNLFYSPMYEKICDEYLKENSISFQNSGGIYSVESKNDGILSFSTVSALTIISAGYSEDVVNNYRACVQNTAILPPVTQAYASRFDSVLHFDKCRSEQLQNVQVIIDVILSEDTRDRLHLPARNDLSLKCHTELNTIDHRVGAVIHHRARAFRVLMTALIREKNTATATTLWHDFLLANVLGSDRLLQVASMNLKEHVISNLGPDAKLAVRLRRMRLLLENVLFKRSQGQSALSVPSLGDLEKLQWRLREESNIQAALNARLPWWQRNCKDDEKLRLEVVAGQVEIIDLKIKAFKHFPTVKLNQVNICANSGLWYFEVAVFTNGLMQIGYVTEDFSADHLHGQGVGDSTNSWAFDGFRCKKWNVHSHDYGKNWKANDVVGVLLDTGRMELSYFLNGEFLEVAFSNIPITCTSRLFPAASLSAHQSIEFNFGSLQSATSSEKKTQVEAFHGFKHIPVLNNDDQTRFKPVCMAHNRHRVDNCKNFECLKGDANGSSTVWNNYYSGERDTDECDITLDNLDGTRRELHLIDMNRIDDISWQRRRDFTGLGSSDEWANRCVVEAHLPDSENRAAAWILEQMEKENGRTVRSEFTTDDLIVDAKIVGDLKFVERLVGVENPLSLVHPSKGLTGFKYYTIDDEFASAATNLPIESNLNYQQCDETASDAFQTYIYKQQLSCLHALHNLETVTHTREVDDFLPLSVVIDSALFVAYARQAFTLLLLSALMEKCRSAAYKLMQQLISREDSGARLCRFLRIIVGLDTLDVGVELDNGFKSVRSEQPVQLQTAIVALLNHELWTLSGTHNQTGNASNRSPLLRLLCREILNQCDHVLSSVHSGKNGTGIGVTQSDALWFAWVSDVVIGFAEDVDLMTDSLPGGNVAPQSIDNVVPLLFCQAFVDKLVAIASNQLTLMKAWKYVAFRLITRISFSVRKFDPSLTFLSSDQLVDLLKLFTLRKRREMRSRVFCSDITSALFALLVHLSTLMPVQDRRPQLEDRFSGIYVNKYSSTEVTISWNSDFSSNLATIINDALIPDDESKDPYVFRLFRGSECIETEDSIILSREILSSGNVAIQNLLPDTQYYIRIDLARAATGCRDLNDQPNNDTGVLQRADIMVKTPPEPMFELDQTTSGKNLLFINRNLTAINTCSKKWHSVRASIGFERGTHSWQVRLDKCVSKNIFVGVCTMDASMENYVGSDAYGYGFLANKAIWHNKAKLQSYGDIFKQGDIIQVTLNCDANTLAFKRNDQCLGIAVSNMRRGTNGSDSNGNCKWYPAISMYNKDDKVTLIPPPVTSVLNVSNDLSQNLSTLELVEKMRDVLAYLSHVNSNSSSLSIKLFEKAFEEFDSWRRDKILYREILLGQVIAIDKSKSATFKYGLASGDTVLTSKGQYTVLGEYRHELWYEMETEANAFQFGVVSCPQLASWSLSACRNMLDSPDIFSIHRKIEHKIDLCDTNSVSNENDVPAGVSGSQYAVSLQYFIDAQIQWDKNKLNATEADSKLIADLDAIKNSKGTLSLSFHDIATSHAMKKKYGNSEDYLFIQTIARTGLLLYVNRCLYNIVRLAIPKNIFATSLGVSETSKTTVNRPSSVANANTSNITEYQQVSPVAALMNSPHWTLDDPSSFTRNFHQATILLFSSQKDNLINEELLRTETVSQVQEGSAAADSGKILNIPIITIKNPTSETLPFWECNSVLLMKKHHTSLHLSTKSSVFLQLTKQLAAQDAWQWRRTSSLSFEAIPIFYAFQVHVTQHSNGPCAENGQHDDSKINDLKEQNENDGEQHRLPSKQTVDYLKLLETAVREIQSPRFPLFGPVPGSMSLRLDVNIDLFSPYALAKNKIERSQLLLWYFCFGQILGIAWRSKVHLPLQFLSTTFWVELVTPVDSPTCSPSQIQSVSMRAIRDGLYSIIPSQCIALLSGDNSSLRYYLSDLDVNYCIQLERHTTYCVPRQSHHNLFWKVVKAFTSVERRMLKQFLNLERQRDAQQTNQTSDSDRFSTFVLEIADALADGQNDPDSCYPVVVSIHPQSTRLHLPAYSSAQILHHKLLLAMTSTAIM